MLLVGNDLYLADCLKVKKIIIIYSQLFLLLSVAFHHASAAVIDQIEFVGNDKTKDALLQREMLSRVGEQLNIRTVEEDVQAIMNLGLFRSVEYYLYAADIPRDGHVKLVIYVRENTTCLFCLKSVMTKWNVIFASV